MSFNARNVHARMPSIRFSPYSWGLLHVAAAAAAEWLSGRARSGSKELACTVVGGEGLK